MRIIICDDDTTFSLELQNEILNFFKKKKSKAPEISVFHNGEDLLSGQPNADIVFLDIEMPGLDGITVGRKLKSQNENVIIFVVTSFLEYLDDAMRFHVFRYLSKPLDTGRLFKNLEDALQLYYSSNTKIGIETKTACHTILSTDIICVEALKRKVTVYTNQGNFESIHSMAYWKNTLAMSCFYETHRSFIVNMGHVSHFDHSLVYLSNDLKAYLTKRKYTKFKENYLMYLESMR